MAYLKEQATWEDGIYQYEITDPLQGGEDGIDNVQGKQLANRTKYLKEKFEKHVSAENPHKVTAAQTGAYSKQEVDTKLAECQHLKQAMAAKFAELTAHGGSTDGRNLLDVFGKTTVAEVMAILHNKCNGEGKADFSGLMIGDYLDLPSLTVGGTTYTWNANYQNLRIVISGFNHYIYCGGENGDKNHILWMFRNIVLRKRMNATSTNEGGYNASELKKYLDEVFAAGLGKELGSSGYLHTIRRSISKKGSVDFVTDTVFLPTEVEVFGAPTCGDDQIVGNTNIQYPIYRDSSFYRVKKYNGSHAWWWEGTPSASGSAGFCAVGLVGGSSHYVANHGSGGIAPAFCTC